MKFNSKILKPLKFKPIEMTITFESKEEAVVALTMFNVSVDHAYNIVDSLEDLQLKSEYQSALHDAEDVSLVLYIAEKKYEQILKAVQYLGKKSYPMTMKFQLNTAAEAIIVLSIFNSDSYEILERADDVLSTELLKITKFKKFESAVQSVGFILYQSLSSIVEK